MNISIQDWSHWIAAGVGAGVTLFARFAVFTLLRTPAQILLSRYWFTKIASIAWPLKHPDLARDWNIVWFVDSKKYPRENIDKARLYKFLNVIAVEATCVDAAGQARKYHFLTRLNGSIISGDWYDTLESRQGYYGHLQLKLSGNMTVADGRWIGFSDEGHINADVMKWSKAS